LPNHESFLIARFHFLLLGLFSALPPHAALTLLDTAGAFFLRLVLALTDPTPGSRSLASPEVWPRANHQFSRRRPKDLLSPSI
jgi:hypothetical protein